MSIELTQKNPYKNLMLGNPVSMTGELCAIIGKNGAGKTRLLEAVKENQIQISLDGTQISQQDIAYFNMQTIKPALQMGFNRVKFQEEIRIAAQVYDQNRAVFSGDRSAVIGQLNNRGRNEHLNVLALYNTVKIASMKTGVEPNSLSKDDISKFYSNAVANALGQQNVTATFLQYVDRLAQNEANNALNIVYKRSLPCYQEGEFIEVYGPPPWDIFNEVLSDVLGGVYFVPEPDIHSSEKYEAKLLRVMDGKEVNHGHLSSGEQVLLWLVISIYNSSINALEHQKPKVILLDEPDAFLHPQMVEKLYRTFEHVIESFHCKVIFTTHSPTTVALFRGIEIYQITETNLDVIEKDIAISGLLEGVTQVSVSYSNRRQVYVESHYDAQIYSELFEFLRVRRIGISNHISLSFIPSGAKLSSGEVRQKALSVLGQIDEDKIEQFVSEIQGIGNCSRVYGTVDSLCGEGCETVYGIVDWDKTNKCKDKVFVSSEEIFYSTENAILNPVSLGFYLLQNYRSKIKYSDFDVEEGTPFSEHYQNIDVWQKIADFVTKKVTGKTVLDRSIACTFQNSFSVLFDAEYVHARGHDLEVRIKKGFPFLNEHNSSEAALKIDVMRKEMFSFSEGKTIPLSLIECFSRIQA
jgi:ABC-type branched-subunit amino acid transport system ATPase component